MNLALALFCAQFYDQPKPLHYQDLETYYNLQNAEQKDSIRQMLDVDLLV